jgi:prepilin-type N-terminal cleavage/methylation domain-containing protein
MPRFSRQRSRAGFTLMELVVSMAVLGLVTTYLTAMMIRQGRTYEVVDEVTEAQQNMRAIGDLLEREIRTTGLMVAEAGPICGIDGDLNGNDILVVTDADSVNPITGIANPITQMTAGNGGIDVGLGSYSGSGTDTLTFTRATIDGVEFYDNDSPPNGVADSDFFSVGSTTQHGAVIVADRDSPSRGVQCGMITGVTGTSVTVDWTFGGAIAAAKINAITSPTDLIVIPAHYYRVTGGANSQLIRDGMILADDVEALQVAYFYDGNDDGLATAGEWRGATSGTVYQPHLVDNGTLREVRINVVVRTQSQDADVRDGRAAFGRSVQLENGPAAGAADGFRRRVYTRNVRPRNVGIRPGEED